MQKTDASPKVQPQQSGNWRKRKHLTRLARTAFPLYFPHFDRRHFVDANLRNLNFILELETWGKKKSLSSFFPLLVALLLLLLTGIYSLAMQSFFFFCLLVFQPCAILKRTFQEAELAASLLMKVPRRADAPWHGEEVLRPDGSHGHRPVDLWR